MTPQQPRSSLSRDDVIDGLRELIGELSQRAQPARIRIVGGAAIVLTVDAARPSTVDIDAPLEPADPILATAAGIASRRGWRSDWINDAARIFLPSGFGSRAAEWKTVYRDAHVTVQVASPDTLLAMKLHAAQRRGNRDAPDLAVLLPACNITTVDAAEQLFTDFYPGDGFTARTAELVRRLLEDPRPPSDAPVLPSLEP